MTFLLNLDYNVNLINLTWNHGRNQTFLLLLIRIGLEIYWNPTLTFICSKVFCCSFFKWFFVCSKRCLILHFFSPLMIQIWFKWKHFYLQHFEHYFVGYKIDSCKMVSYYIIDCKSGFSKIRYLTAIWNTFSFIVYVSKQLSSATWWMFLNMVTLSSC
jgi:hypothetical protein